MLPFDPSKLTIEFVRLKTVSVVLGGSITYLDENLTTDKKEFTHRLKVPLSVARAFIQKTKKVTKYLKPTYVAIAKYDNHVVAMERHPMASMGKLQDGTIRWIPMMESLLKSKVMPAIKNNPNQWYFDGRYVYHFGCTTEQIPSVLRRSKWMTRDGAFRRVVTHAIDMQMLDDKDGLDPKERCSLAFVSPERPDVFNISPPIWKELSNVGMTKLRGKAERGDDEDEDSEREDDEVDGNRIEFIFDEIDARLAVNLNFALAAGVEIGKTFGYEYVEPLHLPRLMTELLTVNLPKVPKQVKATYDINLPFTIALAWLLGLQRRATTLETLIMVRSLMKYLTKKGIFKSDLFQATNVFVEGKSFADLKMKPLDELLAQDDIESIKSSITAALQEKAAKRRRRRDGDDEGHQSIGDMLNEED